MDSKSKKLKVIATPVHCYQIGQKYFVFHPDTGIPYEIETGNQMSEEESDAYNSLFVCNKH